MVHRSLPHYSVALNLLLLALPAVNPLSGFLGPSLGISCSFICNDQRILSLSHVAGMNPRACAYMRAAVRHLPMVKVEVRIRLHVRIVPVKLAAC